MYQSTNVKITFVSESSVTASDDSNAHLVKYTITGQSLAAVDIAKTKAEVRQTIIDAHLSGISTATNQQLQSVSLVDASDSSDLGGAAGGDSSAAAAGSDSTDANQANAAAAAAIDTGSGDSGSQDMSKSCPVL